MSNWLPDEDDANYPETTRQIPRGCCGYLPTNVDGVPGFYEVIPKRLISVFNEHELELLISGLPSIEIDDLKSHTDYHNYQVTSLQWFWRAVRSFDQADRAKFLQFVTGASKAPLNGFAALEGMSGAQKFQIHRDDRGTRTDRLPSALTCFNQLDLPAYETYDKFGRCCRRRSMNVRKDSALARRNLGFCLGSEM